MRVVIAGAHGRVARRLGRLLVARGDAVVGIVPTAEHEAELAGDGIEAVVLDLDRARVDDVAAVAVNADVVVFAAGAEPAGSTPHKDEADRAAAILLADAAEQIAVRPYLLMSSMGVEAAAEGSTPTGLDEVTLAYLRAKWATEEGVRARPAVDLTVLRPGHLTEDPGTGRVALGRDLEPGDVPRDDVAEVMLRLLDAPRPGVLLEVTSGSTPVDDALAALR